MRAYITGVTSTSIWTHYKNGARTFCGHELPDGMKKNQKLPKALLTPSTKAEKGDHDKSVSRAEILEMGALSRRRLRRAAEMCARLFAFGQQRALRRGLILVDTKYEIGRTPDGTLCFIDEIHTPDSSRYWYADDYEARFAKGEEPRGLDKEYVRRTLADQGYNGDGPPPKLTDDVRVEAARRYIQVCELITGQPFVPDTEEPIARIRRNLKLELAAERRRSARAIGSSARRFVRSRRGSRTCASICAHSPEAERAAAAAGAVSSRRGSSASACARRPVSTGSGRSSASRSSPRRRRGAAAPVPLDRAPQTRLVDAELRGEIDVGVDARARRRSRRCVARPRRLAGIGARTAPETARRPCAPACAARRRATARRGAGTARPCRAAVFGPPD